MIYASWGHILASACPAGTDEDLSAVQPLGIQAGWVSSASLWQ